MALWSIGFTANRYRIPPHQISLCPLCITSIRKRQFDHDINIPSLSRLNHTKMLIKTKQHFPCLYRSKVVYDFIKVQYAFAVSCFSVLIKTISHNLPWFFVNQWGPEVWKDQFTERSFAACSNCCITAIVSIICKAIRRMSVRTSGRDNFKLHHLKPAFCNLRLFSYNWKPSTSEL